MINALDKYASDLASCYELEGETGQFQYLIDHGKKSETFNDGEKVDQNKMFGCLAQVWIKFEIINDKFYFRGDSDALIVKGLVSIIVEAFSGYSARDLKGIDHNIVSKLGLGPGLTVRRQVGMMAMVDHIKKISGSKNF
ncbi:MAG: Cysteine desulfuration protein SufE [Alphaproteobacteria bacterium MarineAlpha2_Bin1]|nr:MAG: Cysteine desulfuration protein SufE [Alphaproteobacteria bacterium MarineAlpha2_Bin1]